MNLDEAECRRRLLGADHGVLATVHPDRGVDAVPVVFAVSDHQVVIPVDTVKAKRGRPLTRLTNLARDHRCVLLVEHYEAQWSNLWWVRVHGTAALVTPVPPTIVDLLGARYPPYRTPGVIDQALVLTPTAWYGWQA